MADAIGIAAAICSLITLAEKIQTFFRRRITLLEYNSDISKDGFHLGFECRQLINSTHTSMFCMAKILDKKSFRGEVDENPRLEDVKCCEEYLTTLHTHIVNCLRDRMRVDIDSTPIEFVFCIPATWTEDQMSVRLFREMVDGGLVTPAEPEDGSVTSNDAHGTQTYGALECCRGDRPTQNNTRKIGQNFDMWSLGCVYSEVATWVTKSYDCLLEYRVAQEVHAEQAGVGNGGSGRFYEREKLHYDNAIHHEASSHSPSTLLENRLQVGNFGSDSGVLPFVPKGLIDNGSTAKTFLIKINGLYNPVIFLDDHSASNNVFALKKYHTPDAKSWENEVQTFRKLLRPRPTGFHCERKDRLRGDRIVLGEAAWKSIFDPCIAKMVDQIDLQLHAAAHQNAPKALCMGGGFTSESWPLRLSQKSSEKSAEFCQVHECCASTSSTTLSIFGRPADFERHRTGIDEFLENVGFWCRHNTECGTRDNTFVLKTYSVDSRYKAWSQEVDWRWLSTRANAVLNTGSALGMGGSFWWLNESMDLYHPSAVMKWVTNNLTHIMPATVENVLQHVPNAVKFAGFAAATVVFTGTTFAWIARTKDRTPIIVSTITSGLWVLFWLMLGVAIEELILTCVPLSVSLGILASCLCRPREGRQAVVNDKCSV